MKSEDRILIAYVATPHNGYVEMFEKYRGGILYLLSEEFTADFKPILRHLPGNKLEHLVVMIHALGIFSEVRVLTMNGLRDFAPGTVVSMPEEDISEKVAKKYFPHLTINWDSRWRLRWDWKTTTHQKQIEGEVISTDALDRHLMLEAKRIALRSSDWWRQIGAILVRDGKPLVSAYNMHFPSEQSPYLMGDPRSNFEPGQNIELSGAGHGERRVIALAAREGISTKGCDMYVSTFPCPGCAYQCAEIGLKRLYYADGYSLTEGATSLRSYGVELIRVQLETPSS